MKGAAVKGSVPFYGPEQVRAALDYDGCIAAVRAAMADFSADGKPQPLRSIFELAPARFFGLMPGTLAAPQGFGAKVLSVFGDPARPGRSAHRGVVLLFDRDSGEVTCIADAGEVTEIRTAAASAVATDVLARRDAKTLALFGCGAQAASHIRALVRVRRFEQVLVWGRAVERAAGFAERMQREVGVPVRAVAEPHEAASAADVICTVTSSHTPVLLGEWVRPGTHVNVVGSSYAGPVEVNHALVRMSRYIVDSRRSALAAAAEFLLAKEAGLIDDSHIVAEIGEVLLGRIPGRTSPEEVTVYKSLGHIVQDLAATTYVHARAGSGS
ncbi:MAG TPA: ornithine cyclodeaminase family protein [Steroidobacteraceae bacterium]|nr:ornithine cyclodeaminase family protein [Steroidobacteraceae bacterium]